MKTTVLAGLILSLAAQPVLAQAGVVERKTPKREYDWTFVRVAKWALLGGAIGFGAYALSESEAAQRDYAALRDRCAADPPVCEVFNGRYRDATSEHLYQRTVVADRRAQIGIYGGQIAVLGSVGLFIYDLRNGRGPSDIPYPSRRAVAIGARLSW